MERLACMKRHPRRGCNSGMGRKPGTRARAARPAAATRSRVDKIPFPCVCLVKLHECFREILPGPIQGGEHRENGPAGTRAAFDSRSSEARGRR